VALTLMSVASTWNKDELSLNAVTFVDDMNFIHQAKNSTTRYQEGRSLGQYVLLCFTFKCYSPPPPPTHVTCGSLCVLGVEDILSLPSPHTHITCCSYWT